MLRRGPAFSLILLLTTACAQLLDADGFKLAADGETQSATARIP